jgi:hypothetical protein
MFALAPASRWGYFVYPAALMGLVGMTHSEPGPEATALRQRERQERQEISPLARWGDAWS